VLVSLHRPGVVWALLQAVWGLDGRYVLFGLMVVHVSIGLEILRVGVGVHG